MKKTEENTDSINPSRSARAAARYLRISPRKVRPVINTIRFKPVGQAFRILTALNKKAARLTEKLLKSAVANGKGLGLEEDRLYISKIFADGGPVFKRFMARSMGRTDRILKRTTHLTIMLEEGKMKKKELDEPGAKEKEEKKPKAAKTKKAPKKMSGAGA